MARDPEFPNVIYFIDVKNISDNISLECTDASTIYFSILYIKNRRKEEGS
jgi:hypothetical protein